MKIRRKASAASCWIKNTGKYENKGHADSFVIMCLITRVFAVGMNSSRLRFFIQIVRAQPSLTVKY